VDFVQEWKVFGHCSGMKSLWTLFRNEKSMDIVQEWKVCGHCLGKKRVWIFFRNETSLDIVQEWNVSGHCSGMKRLWTLFRNETSMDIVREWKVYGHNTRWWKGIIQQFQDVIIMSLLNLILHILMKYQSYSYSQKDGEVRFPFPSGVLTFLYITHIFFGAHLVSFLVRTNKILLVVTTKRSPVLKFTVFILPSCFLSPDLNTATGIAQSV
jgi:hypothetical protein